MPPWIADYQISIRGPAGFTRSQNHRDGSDSATPAYNMYLLSTYHVVLPTNWKYPLEYLDKKSLCTAPATGNFLSISFWDRFVKS